jgi:hypothetical protein
MKNILLYEEFAQVAPSPGGNVSGMGPVVPPTSTSVGSGDAWPSLGEPSIGAFPARKRSRKKRKKYVKTYENFHLNEAQRIGTDSYGDPIMDTSNYRKYQLDDLEPEVPQKEREAMSSREALINSRQKLQDLEATVKGKIGKLSPADRKEFTKKREILRAEYRNKLDDYKRDLFNYLKSNIRKNTPNEKSLQRVKNSLEKAREEKKYLGYIEKDLKNFSQLVRVEKQYEVEAPEWDEFEQDWVEYLTDTLGMNLKVQNKYLLPTDKQLGEWLIKKRGTLVGKKFSV